jgi:hypothetical protein
MATLIQYLPWDNGTFTNFKLWAQGFSNAFNTFGWVPSSDSGIINSTGNYGTATITNVQINNNVLQVTFSGATNQFAPGQVVQLTGLTTNTFLNNQYVKITNPIASATATNGESVSLTLSSVANASGGTTVYTGTITNGGTNAYQNVTFVVTGFTNSANNGTFVCTASTTTTLTLYNPSGVSETHAATATQQPDRTNSLFTALFTHADVASGSDTGTVTAVYNWNTVANLPDTTESNYASREPKTFRGNWVGTTPAFTNLQTTNNQTIISFGTNGHGLDLTHSVGQGLFIQNAPSPFTFLNTNPTSPAQGYYAGWPIVSLTSTTITINTASSPRADIASTAVTAGTGEPVYIGGNSNSTQSINDCVLYGGELYEATVNTAAGIHGTANQPGLNTSNWKRVYWEIWTSADSLSSTNKLYLKLQYGTQLTSGNYPIVYLYFGTATDGNTNISQNMNWGTTNPVSSVAGSATIVTTGAALWESDFSGSSGRFSAIVWRGYNAAVPSPAFCINIERSHDSSGNDTDAYWTIVTAFASTTNLQQSIFKAGTGGPGVLEVNNVSTIKTIACVNNQNINNSVCVLPIFPVVGFVGNPMYNMIALKNGDAFEGAFLSVTLYGSSHTYLTSKAGNTTGGGPANFGAPGAGSMACGLRWE